METPVQNTVEATKRVIEYPLSDGDINRLLSPDPKILIYSDLENMGSINEIFDPMGRCMLLYPVSSEYSGHWVCLIKHKDRLEFFDPYGKAPDTELKWIGKAKRREFNVEEPTLTRLLKESGEKVSYNSHDFQEDEQSVNTCGRHCVVRLMFKDMSLDEYRKMIKESGLSPDEFVSGITYLKLQK
jgi:hypothetical protein